MIVKCYLMGPARGVKSDAKTDDCVKYVKKWML